MPFGKSRIRTPIVIAVKSNWFAHAVHVVSAVNAVFKRSQRETKSKRNGPKGRQKEAKGVKRIQKGAKRERKLMHESMYKNATSKMHSRSENCRRHMQNLLHLEIILNIWKTHPGTRATNDTDKTTNLVPENIWMESECIPELLQNHLIVWNTDFQRTTIIHGLFAKKWHDGFPES